MYKSMLKVRSMPELRFLKPKLIKVAPYEYEDGLKNGIFMEKL